MRRLCAWAVSTPRSSTNLNVQGTNLARTRLRLFQERENWPSSADLAAADLGDDQHRGPRRHGGIGVGPPRGWVGEGQGAFEGRRRPGAGRRQIAFLGPV